MRTVSIAVLAVVMTGAASLAAPSPAQARFGAGVIADAAADLSVMQRVQHRPQQRPRRAQPPRTATPQPFDTVSPYRYPGSRGALDSCAFC